MTAANAALACRAVILCCLMLCAVLAPLNAWAYLRSHRAPTDRKNRRLNVLKAVSVATYGCAAFYGTYLRFNAEFSWGLPGMAVGLVGYTVYLFCHNSPDDEPRLPATLDDMAFKRLMR